MVDTTDASTDSTELRFTVPARTAKTIEAGDAAESIAHDLNNVFSLITMAAELLGALDIGDEERRFLQIIEDGTTRGVGLSRRLFALVKGTEAQ